MSNTQDHIGAGPGGGGGGGSTSTFSQAGNTYLVGDWILKLDALAAEATGPAKADEAVNAEPLFGVITTAGDPSATVTSAGLATIPSHGLSLGKNIYLDQTVSLSVTTIAPTSGVYKSVGFVIDANTIDVRIGDTVELGGSNNNNWVITGATTNAVAGGYYLIGAGDLLNLPPTPLNNDTVTVAQGDGDLGVSSATVDGGAENISDNVTPLSTTDVLDTNFAGRIVYIFNSTLNQWKVT